MKRKVLQIDGANMAGFEWTYEFWLSRARDRTLTLSLKQSAEEHHLDVEPATHLTTGVDVYRALHDVLSAAGYAIGDFDVEEIATRVADVDAGVAAELRTAARDIEAADDARQQSEKAREQAFLTPYETRIDAYVMRFSDEKLYYPGAGRVYPSKRSWVKAFIRQYLLSHGVLPTGTHKIEVGGYGGGTADFSDLGSLGE